MAQDNLPTLWRADPHTLAKLAILRRYLQAWMPILTKGASKYDGGELVYIDAFAGPGQYSSGESGSPLEAINVACKHDQDFLVPVRMYFIEKRRDRWESLRGLLAPFRSGTRNAIVEAPILGSADTEVAELVKSSTSYKPTLVFLDQFGYSAVPMALVSQILEGASGEVFSFMNWRDLNHYLSDRGKWAGIDRTFGGKEWREVLELHGLNKSNRFLQIYDEALKKRAKAEFSCTFSMHDRNDQLLYWLVFCTNSDLGLEVMKKAMWKIDATGGFRFSDKHTSQLSLLDGFDQRWLAERLASSLEGQEMTVGEVWHHVLTKTPCHQFNEALSILEADKRLSIIKSPAGRRRRSFERFKAAKNFIVRFGRVPTQLLLL